MNEYDIYNSPSLKNWGAYPKGEQFQLSQKDVVIYCGWGHILFGHTFDSMTVLVEKLLDEAKDQRDVALYIRDPQLVLAEAPQDIFLDPSNTYRLFFDNYLGGTQKPSEHIITKMMPEDVLAVNQLLAKHRMMKLHDDITDVMQRPELVYVVAKEKRTNEIVGFSMGVDHVLAFDDPEKGSSIWSVAVDTNIKQGGVGKALICYLIDHFINAQLSHVDLSVMHNNKKAISFYRSLGFERVPGFCIKRKNRINEDLYVGPSCDRKLNPYEQIIVDEARRRGIKVESQEEQPFLELSLGGRCIVIHESLSELTSSIAMIKCSNKRLTHSILESHNIMMPPCIVHYNLKQSTMFLEKQQTLVVKPVIGEQGQGISIGIKTEAQLEDAINYAQQYNESVLLEKHVEGIDLRVVVIGFEVVAASIRKPPFVIGDGKTTIEHLIEKQSKRREQATQGESYIPIDQETISCLAGQGVTLFDVPDVNQWVQVRRPANLHQGGTIHDVTRDLHPTLGEVSVKIAKVLNIPVVGLDFMVEAVDKPNYWMIEANERPGLANHEPQPTAQKFIDMLFPDSVGVS